MTSTAPVSCWVLSDGAAGNERQARALAAALGGGIRVVRLHVREPWATLAPRLVIGARSAIRDAAGDPLAPPWPDIAIGCGRRAALATRALRDWSEGRTFTVQILDPRIDPRAFDVVVAPQHDRVRGDNVIRSIGALNPVDAAWLQAGRAAFPAFGELAAPRTVVLVGATNAAQRIDRSYFDTLLERLAAWHAHDGGSYLVSASRRTPPEIAAHLRSAFADWPGIFWSYPDDGPNPYAGFLGWADRFVVTPDSVNMISEASATGKPVYTFAPRAITGKLARFHAELRASGHLRMLDAVSERPQAAPLDETRAIAEIVRERWLASKRGA
ncbi:MAG TPA: mitochondrial fission ELM1 family protein [Rhodanobacteraceae bacterium]|nr:mitochondrial fission ELM1 family protein [Rhodanobacteraceae bacterium]